MQLLADFRTFCAQMPEPFADFELKKHSENRFKYLVAEKSVPYFHLIGQQASGSLICFWQYEEGIALNNQPLVWLDSEGFPRAVFANDFETFLQLLPYGTGAIYDIITAVLNSRDPSKKSKKITNLFDTNRLNSCLQTSQKSFPAHDLYLHWLDEKKLAPSLEPVSVIQSAYTQFPNLEEWLNESSRPNSRN